MSIPGIGGRVGLGGSQAAAAIGLSPYQAPITLWQEFRGVLPPFEGNEKTHWGTLLEPAIRQEYVNRHGVHVIVPEHSLFADGWRRATADGLVLGPGNGGDILTPNIDRGLEVKAPGLRMADQWGESGSESVPILYEIQGRWYMSIYDVDRWDYAVLIGGQEYREYSIERDLEVEEAIVSEASEFWVNHVLAGEPPEPDATSEYSEYLTRAYAEKRPEYLQASVELDEQILELIDARSAFKVAEAHKKALENEVRFAIGSHAGVDCSLGRIKNTLVKGRKTTDWKSIAHALSLLAAPAEVLRVCGALVGADVGASYLSHLEERHTKRGAPHHRFYFPKEKSK